MNTAMQFQGTHAAGLEDMFHNVMSSKGRKFIARIGKAGNQREMSIIACNSTDAVRAVLATLESPENVSVRVA